MEHASITADQRAIALEDDDLVVHAWRAEQLHRLGLHSVIAETFADLVDWHALEALVARGCSPELALDIVR